MKAEASTIALISQFEGRKYIAYNDTAGKKTIGDGHLIKPSESHLLTATLTDAQCDELLLADATVFASSINRGLKKPLNQNQFDAVCSFAFNLGMANLTASTLWANINSGKPVTEQNFTAYCKERIGGVLQLNKGLLRRRTLEYQLFIKPIN